MLRAFAFALLAFLGAPFALSNAASAQPAPTETLTPADAATDAASTEEATVDVHTPWDELLGRYVTLGRNGAVNRFDYTALKASQADQAALNAYIAALEATRVSELTPDEQFAFWANLYNAVTIRVIIKDYPVKSIRSIKSRGISIGGLIGPWKTRRVRVEGQRMSLDDIEHGTMRPQFGDPRVHYAVNCASIGCPNLQPKAWRAATLDVDLDAAARAYVNSPRGVIVRENGLQVSTIYKWFREDFGDSEEGVIAHLLEYAEPALAEQIRANPSIARHAYDWGLNDAVVES